jgi:signal transduction histidine kinase
VAAALGLILYAVIRKSLVQVTDVGPNFAMYRPVQFAGVLTLALVAIAVLGVALRRRRPVLMLALLLAGSMVMSVLTGQNDSSLIYFFPIAYVLFLIAANYKTKRAAVRVLAAVFITMIIDIVLGGLGGHYPIRGALVPVFLCVVIAWSTGYIVRQRRRYAIGLQEEAASKAVAEERLRIARELHDIVAHSMSVIAVQAGYGQYVIDSQPGDARAALGAIQATSREALDEMRRMLGALRQADADQAREVRDQVVSAAGMSAGTGRPVGDGYLAGDGHVAGTGRWVGDGRSAGTGRPAGDGRSAGTGGPAGDGRSAGTGRPAGDGRSAGTGRPVGDGRSAGTGRPVGDGRSGGDGDQVRGVSSDAESGADTASEGDGPRPGDALGALAALFRSGAPIPAAPSTVDTAAAPLFPSPGLDDLDRLLNRTASAGVQVELRRKGIRRTLPPSIDLSAYRIIQEALTNVVKHAHASKCNVLIDYGETELTIRVTDSGADLPVPALVGAAAAARGVLTDPLPGGHGIIGMRERVSMLGGEFSAGPLPGYGFEVIARIPLPAGGTS